MTSTVYSVFVGHLVNEVCETDLRELFAACGELVDVHLQEQGKDRRHTFGFVRFKEYEDALRAVREMHGWLLKGQRMLVELAQDCPRVFKRELVESGIVTIERQAALISKQFHEQMCMTCPDEDNGGSFKALTEKIYATPCIDAGEVCHEPCEDFLKSFDTLCNQFQDSTELSFRNEFVQIAGSPVEQKKCESTIVNREPSTVDDTVDTEYTSSSPDQEEQERTAVANGQSIEPRHASDSETKMSSPPLPPAGRGSKRIDMLCRFLSQPNQ